MESHTKIALESNVLHKLLCVKAPTSIAFIKDFLPTELGEGTHMYLLQTQNPVYRKHPKDARRIGNLISRYPNNKKQNPNFKGNGGPESKFLKHLRQL